MRISLTILTCLFSITIIGQNNVQGIIKNAETNEPIPYVNIGILNKDKGTVSDDKGNFKLEIPKEFDNDTIRISSIGYKPKSFIAKELIEKIQTNSIIELIPDAIELNEVVVSSKNLKEKVLGNKTRSKSMQAGFKNAQLGNELGIKIKIKESPTYVKKFHVNVNSNTGESMKFRLNFYNIKDGLPYERISNENIIFKIDVKQGEFILDLAKYNIVLEDDFFFTIEFIENQKEGEEISFSAGLLGKSTVARRTSQGEWKKIGAVGIGFSLTVKY